MEKGLLQNLYHVAIAVRDLSAVEEVYKTVLGAVTLMIFLTEVASNTASAAILVPIFLVLGQEIGHFPPYML